MLSRVLCCGAVIAGTPKIFGELPESIAVLRHAGPLHLGLRAAAQDVSLSLEPHYTTQTLGDRLTTTQVEKLDRIRTAAPDKFEILQTLFPRQIAEYLLRTDLRVAPPASADDPVQRLVLEIAGDYLSAPTPVLNEEQQRARGEFLEAALGRAPQDSGLRMVLQSAARYQDADFGSPAKANAFLALQNKYSPYKPVGMSRVGDTLSIGGQVVTDRLATDAAKAGRTADQLASERYDALCRELAHWRDAQLTGNAYAGTIKSFLSDPRLATFTPEEIHRAYHRVFGRELKIDLEADGLAAQLGHPVTYLELQNHRK